VRAAPACAGAAGNRPGPPGTRLAKREAISNRPSGQGDCMMRVLLALVMTAIVGATLVGCKAEVEEAHGHVGAAR